jgi:SAM-dependent methyltransferase
MDGAWGNLKLFAAEHPRLTSDGGSDPVTPPPQPALSPSPQPPDPCLLANRELIRPIGYRRAAPGLVPFSAAWYDELEQKRYQRHGVWLPAALEFGRHPGESLLMLGPGIGSDAVRYMRSGTPVTIGVTPYDHADLVRENLTRLALPARIVDIAGPRLPFADGTFDVVAWNALFDPAPPAAELIDELFRVLKSGGKVIGLFPARYDAGYWQDLLLPLQWIYWHRPADPTDGTKTTAHRLRRRFAAFAKPSVGKRHLRRSELPHPWRVLPLVLLERLIGRVLVFKAFKPLSAKTGISIPLAA